MSVTRSAAVALVGVSLFLSAAGCSGSTSSSAKTAEQSRSPSAGAGAQQQVDPCRNLKPATGLPAKTFGGKKVSAGYCEMLRFTLEGSFLSNLMGESAFRPSQFAPFRAYMTPVAKRAWDRDVVKVSTSGARQRAAFNGILSITYLDITGTRYTLGNSQTRRPVSNRKFTSGRASVVRVNGAPRLNLSLRIAFQFNLTEKQTKGAIAVKGRKSITYTLVENPVATKNQPWLIDGWHGSSRFGTIKRVDGGQ